MASTSHRLAEITHQLLDLGAVEALCHALDAGDLRIDATIAAHAPIADGRELVVRSTRSLQELWRLEYPSLAPAVLSVLIRGVAAALEIERARAPRIQVVWTGPNIAGSYVRTTRQVVCELIDAASRDLLVVGYWLGTGRADSGDAVEEVLSAIGRAMARKVRVTLILDERRRYDGVDNRAALAASWPFCSELPVLLTWRLPANDRHSKLHAKVIVADAVDALVTSANLTAHALDKNIEMGVRVGGVAAADIARHFHLLVEGGVLEKY